MHVEMSLSNNRTAELWRAFMPRRQSVLNRIGSHYFSLQKYVNAGRPKPDTLFEKWAVVAYSGVPGHPFRSKRATCSG